MDNMDERKIKGEINLTHAEYTDEERCIRCRHFTFYPRHGFKPNEHSNSAGACDLPLSVPMIGFRGHIVMAYIHVLKYMKCDYFISKRTTEEIAQGWEAMGER